ncbi:MAG: acyltransferase domain-containing protein [Pseudomonadota bacterium]
MLPALLAASGQRASLRRERAVIMGETPAGLDAALGALADADGEALETVRCAAVLRGSAAAVAAMPGGDSPHTGGVCDGGSMPGVPVGFLFAGNGAQWAGMGEALWATDAAYAAGFERASAALAAAGGSDPRALRKDPSLGDRLTESGPAQAFLFALQVGLVDALAAAGMRPAAVLGHSVGEVTAAWAAGALALADAARIIALRAEAVAPLHGQGTMAALLSSPEEAASLIEAAGLSGQVGVAALNSPRSVTVSGSVDGIDALGRQARQARLAMRKLPVPYPYHNAEMALIRAPLMAGLATLEPCHAEAAVLYSSVSGGRLAGPEDVTAAPLDAEHWWRNAREPVQFWPAAEAMVASGVGYLVEIGPRPVLTGYLRALRRPGCDQVVTCVAAMEGPGREGPAPRSLAAAGLASGAAISRDFLGPLRAAPGHVPAAGCAAPRPGTRPDTPLPRTPLTRSRYQAALGPEAIDLFGLAAEAEAEGSGDHPAAAPGLLGLRDRPGAGPWHARLDPTLHPWIADHRVDGHAVLPAAAFAAIALAAGREVGKSDIVEIEGLDILAPLQVPDDGVDLRTSLDAHRGALVIESRPQGSALPFRAHARATLRRTPAPGAGVALAEALASRAREAADTRGGAAPDAGTEELRIPAAALYEALSRSGLDYGPHFRLLHGSAAVSRCDDGAARVSGLVRAAPPEGLDGSGGVEAAREAFRGTLPPMLLDACFHVLAALLTPAEARSTWLPVRIARLWLAEAMPEAAEDWHVTARFRTRRAAWLSADVSVADANGTPFLAIEGLGLEARALPGLSGLEDWAEAWVPLAPPPRGETGEDPGRTGPLAPAGQTPRKPARPLAALLEEAGHWRDIEPSPDAALLLEELCKHAIADVLGPSPQAAVQPSLGDEALRAMLTARLRADAKAAASADGGAPENAGLADHLAPVAGIIDRLLSHHNGCSAALQGALALPEALRHALAEIRPDGAEPEGGPRPAMPLSQEAALAPLLRVLEGVVGDAVPVRLEKPEGPGHPSLGHAAWVMNGADKTADPATCSIWVVSSEGALAPDLAVPASLSSGDVLAVVTPAIGSMFAEEPAAHALATHLEREGFADVRVGWFDAGTHVLALVAARGLGETAAGMPDQPPLQELSPPAGDPAAFLLLHDPGRTGQVAAMALSARWPGAEVRSLASPGCVSGREVVVLPPVPETPAGARACIGRRIALGRAFLRHLAEDKQAAPRGLTFFASPSEGAPAGSASVGAVDDALGARQAAVAMASGALDGFVRTLVNEAPSLPVRMVTTDDDAAALEALAAMPPAAEEPLLALVGNAWAVPRVARREIGPAAGPRRLATRLPGALDSLHWEPAAMPRPGPGEVLIAVEAAGLNFRDVMWAQRRLPAEALELGHAGAQLGMECAGRGVDRGGGGRSQFSRCDVGAASASCRSAGAGSCGRAARHGMRGAGRRGGTGPRGRCPRGSRRRGGIRRPGRRSRSRARGRRHGHACDDGPPSRGAAAGQSQHGGRCCDRRDGPDRTLRAAGPCAIVGGRDPVASRRCRRGRPCGTWPCQASGGRGDCNGGDTGQAQARAGSGRHSRCRQSEP